MAPSTIFDDAVTPLHTGTQSSKVVLDRDVVKPTQAVVSDSGLTRLDASKITITHNLKPSSVPAFDSPEVWGQNVVIDHMVTASWTSAAGWAAPALHPYGPFSIMPTASVLHYATECFEGMKAYRGYDGKLRLFRPQMNCNRLLRSALRIALPGFDPLELLKLIKRLLAVDGPKWLRKDKPGQFLYLRPAMIATTAAIGVQKPNEALLFVIGLPMPPLDDVSKAPPSAGALAPKRPNTGMRLLASSADQIRAWPGGFGNAKVGGNYGPTLAVQGEARAKGFDQLLWLFGEEGVVTEAGASNFFVVWRTKEGKLELVTAPLTGGIILPGITRDSVLAIARERFTGTMTATPDDLENLDVVERTFTMSEIAQAACENRLLEAFASGTAYFIAPVSEIEYRGQLIRLPLATTGAKAEYALQIKQWLRDIMYGNVQHEWGFVVEEEDHEVESPTSSSAAETPLASGEQSEEDI